MDEPGVRELIKAHFAASAVGAPGGSPDDDIAAASEIYAEHAVLEWPQGRERVRGRANIIAFRSTYPTRMEFELHRITGRDDLWVNEYTIRYDDRPVMAAGIMEFRAGKVVHERIYFGGALGTAGLAGPVGRTQWNRSRPEPGRRLNRPTAAPGGWCGNPGFLAERGDDHHRGLIRPRRGGA